MPAFEWGQAHLTRHKHRRPVGTVARGILCGRILTCDEDTHGKDKIAIDTRTISILPDDCLGHRIVMER